MLEISNKVSLPLTEITLKAIRSQGPGGQNVNKVSTAIHLFFDITSSSLPDFYKMRLLKLSDQRITKEGVVVLKSQGSRSQETNKEDALKKLQILIKSVAVVPKKRRATKASRSSQRKRMDSKSKRGQVKALRNKITED